MGYSWGNFYVSCFAILLLALQCSCSNPHTTTEPPWNCIFLPWKKDEEKRMKIEKTRVRVVLVVDLVVWCVGWGGLGNGTVDLTLWHFRLFPHFQLSSETERCIIPRLPELGNFPASSLSKGKSFYRRCCWRCNDNFCPICSCVSHSQLSRHWPRQATKNISILPGRMQF